MAWRRRSRLRPSADRTGFASTKPPTGAARRALGRTPLSCPPVDPTRGDGTSRGLPVPALARVPEFAQKTAHRGTRSAGTRARRQPTAIGVALLVIKV